MSPPYSRYTQLLKSDPPRAYTGYIDVEAHHLFWFFFESRGDPDADDVIFWTNGGPGGSGAVGLFSELGERGCLCYGTVTGDLTSAW